MALDQNTTPPPFPEFLKDGPFIPTAANFPVKFDGTNYPVWQRQVHGLFRRLRLLGLLNGSIDLSATDSTTLRWCDQDALLQQAMITSFSPAVLSSISTAVTCRDIWVALENIYANASPTRLLNLTERLQHSRKKPEQSMSDFLHHLHSLANELDKLDHPVAPNNFKLYVINGIQAEFPECAGFLRGSREKWSFEDLHEYLVSCEEGRLYQQLNPGPVTANAAFRHPGTPWSSPAPAGVSPGNFSHWQSAEIGRAHV